MIENYKFIFLYPMIQRDLFLLLRLKITSLDLPSHSGFENSNFIQLVGNLNRINYIISEKINRSI